MVHSTTSGFCSFIIVVLCITLFQNVVQCKYPENSTEPNHNHTKVSNEFYNFTRKDGSNWIIPKFRYNNYSDLTFCSNNATIRVPVFLHTNVTTIPCWTTWGYPFNSATDILIYKGTPDTTLTLISGQSRIVGYVTGIDFGFRYNFTGDSEYLGNYTCFIANSSGENYVITEIYRDDNAASVYSSDCSLTYSVNDTGTFFCRVERDTSNVTFEWSLKMNDGSEIRVYPNPKRKKEIDYNDGTVGERIRVKLPSSDVVGVGCRVRRKDSIGVFQGLQRVVVEELKVPEVLDNETELLSLDDGSGLPLECRFIVRDSSTSHVFWLINGTDLLGSYFEIAWSKPIGVTSLKDVYVTSSTANYTCVAKNVLGVSRKTFLVSRKGQFVYTFVVPVVSSVVLLVLGIVEWKRRTAYLIKCLMQVRSLKSQDPGGSSLMVVQDSDREGPLAKGANGEVWETTVKYANNDKEHRAVIKTFIVTPFLSAEAAELLFEDLINEIKICQKLNENECPYVVRYLGLHAPSVQHFKVYLVLEYCHPGQLLNVVRTHREENTFVDDVNEISVEERRRLERDDGYRCLSMTHLIKWAYQIAEAVKYLHGNNIVHRDLAARNILLKAPTDDDEFDSFDQVIAQLADFGLSRFVETGPYVIKQGTLKPRSIPFAWYPPQSIGFGPDVEYTKKSDVWSFGILLWEMFSLGYSPDGFMGYACGPNDLKEELVNGKRLGRESLRTIPDELWTLMEDCWKYDPSERPDFSVICQRLKELNNRLGLNEQRNVNQEGEHGDEESSSGGNRANVGNNDDDRSEDYDDNNYGSTLNLISNEKNHINISSRNSCALHIVHR